MDNAQRMHHRLQVQHNKNILHKLIIDVFSTEKGKECLLRLRDSCFYANPCTEFEVMLCEGERRLIDRIERILILEQEHIS